MLSKCDAGEDSWESLGQQGDQKSILKEINTEYSLEGLLLRLQYFGHLMQRDYSLEKTLESPLDCKEINPVNPKGNQPWVFTGRTDAEAPKLWSPEAKSWLIGKDPAAGKDWRQEEKEED